MLAFCLRPGEIEGRKMLDFTSKAAIDFLEWHVSIQASNLAFPTIESNWDIFTE
jgi:hypothetical protein